MQPLPATSFEYMPAPLLRRSVAYLIDAAITAALFFLLNGVGVAYWLARDGLFRGRSVGKAICGLRVIDFERGQACSLTQAVLRQLVFLIPLFFFVEVVSLLTDPRRRRLGDHWSDSAVVSS
jgi:uncharacterized RDD family membrane protein YckC